MKKFLKTLGIILAVMAAMVAVCIVVAAICSPGRLKPVSKNEKVFVEIGGVKQGMFIRGENIAENPVVLFLHGGPGSPELPMILAAEKPERLEKYFTVCYWDQRGAGMSFEGSLTPTDATLERYIEDTREVTEYLCRRFGQEKIVLMGHSWGSYLGVKTIQKYPQLYRAYIGVGQVTRQLESERIAYDYMLAHAGETGDKKAIESLQKYNPEGADFPSLEYLAGPRTALMNKYRIGITRAPVSVASIVKDIMLFGGYTLSEKVKYARGTMFSLVNAFHYTTDDDLFVSARRFEIPVYVIHGKYDYQVSQKLAGEWIGEIEAPKKGFFMFENSAHSPNVEEPEKFVSTVREIAAAHQ